jgi:hypothetical protein
VDDDPATFAYPPNDESSLIVRAPKASPFGAIGDYFAGNMRQAVNDSNARPVYWHEGPDYKAIAEEMRQPGGMLPGFWHGLKATLPSGDSATADRMRDLSLALMGTRGARPPDNPLYPSRGRTVRFVDRQYVAGQETPARTIDMGDAYRKATEDEARASAWQAMNGLNVHEGMQPEKKPKEAPFMGMPMVTN